MALDLASLTARDTPQGRVTQNRDSTMPRRDTNLPDLEVNATIGSGARGDKGSEIARIFGMAQDAAEAIGHNTIKATEAELAYTKATAQIDAKAAAGDAEVAIKTTMTEFLNNAKDANGDGKFDLQDVDELITSEFSKAALDPATGKPLDYGHPAGVVAMHKALSTLRPKLLEEARKVIVGQEHDRVTAAEATNVARDAASNGGVYNIGAGINALPPQIDKTKAKAVFLQAAFNDAEERGNFKGLDKLAGELKPDGTAAFTPAEIARIQDKRDAVETKVRRESDRKEKELHEATAFSFIQRSIDGKPPTRSEISEAVRTGRLPATTGQAMVNHIESEARADQRAAVAAGTSAAGAAAELQAVTLAAQWAMGQGPTDPGQALAEGTRLLQTGRLGPGKQGVSNLNSLLAASKAGRAAVASRPDFRTFGTSIQQHFTELLKKPAAGDLLGQARARAAGKGAEVATRTQYAAAMQAYTDLVLKQGKAPAAAYAEVSKTLLTPKTSAQRLAELEAKSKR